MNNPTLYVIAGPNGSGKSTSYDLYIPDSIPYINTDSISAKIKEKYPYLSNTQEQANAEATRVFNKHIQARESYGFESNLHDAETWKFIEAHKRLEYDIKMIFLTVDNLKALNQRIKVRVQNGGHFVRPDIVEARYLAAHNLLEHYYLVPDTLNIIDASSNDHRQIMVIQKGKVIMQTDGLPEKIATMINKIEEKKRSGTTKKLTLEEIRQRYKSRKGNDKGFKL